MAVRHLRRGAPDVPIWLFAVMAPDPDTASLCERVVIGDDGLALLVEAEKQLWSQWVALSVATWTGEHGRWALKLAPFLVPPFRTLFLNENGDFFSGTPGDGCGMGLTRGGIELRIYIVDCGCGALR